MKCYMMTWNLGLEGGGTIDRQTILAALDKDPTVVNWRAAVGAIFIISEKSQFDVGLSIHNTFPKLHFVVTPLDAYQLGGWADKDTWDFIVRPRRIGEA
jgi:hypothetical protein